MSQTVDDMLILEVSYNIWKQNYSFSLDQRAALTVRNINNFSIRALQKYF